MSHVAGSTPGHTPSSRHTDPGHIRRAYAFAPQASLRARVASVMTSGLYTVPDWDTRKKTTGAVQQTDRIALRDIGVCDGIVDNDEEQRHIDLKINIPTPGMFPVLTVAQLLDAQKRIMDLITRLELEIGRCHDEEVAKKAAINPLTTNGSYVSTSEWTQHMRERVTDRLRARGQDDAEVAFYAHKLMLASSPQRRQLVTASPRREAALAIARAPPLMQIGVMNSQQELHAEQQRAVEDALAKAQSRRKSVTSFAGAVPTFQRARQ